MKTIDPRIIKALGLSDNEVKVFDVVYQIRPTSGRDASKIARAAGLSRMTGRRILDKLEKRGLITKKSGGILFGKRYLWQYKPHNLEKFKYIFFDSK